MIMWYFYESPRIWPDLPLLPVNFRSIEAEENLVWYILKICLKNLKVFWSLFRRRGQAFGFNGTWNSETEILSDDLENNHVSKVTEFLNHVFKYQMANLQISKMFEFVFVCSCLFVWTVSVRSKSNMFHFMFGIRRVKSVIYAILSHTIKISTFYNLHCIV